VLAQTLYFDAKCALRSGDKAGAQAGFKRCLEIRSALVNDPHIKMPQVDVMVALARCGKHAEAAAIAAKLIESPPRDEYIYFQAACGYALSSAAAAADLALAKRYAGAAIDCLKKGKERGWADPVSLETDPDLEPIREDPAFRALLAEFRQAGGK
jgi:hypothetical protein